MQDRSDRATLIPVQLGESRGVIERQRAASDYFQREQQQRSGDRVDDEEGEIDGICDDLLRKASVRSMGVIRLAVGVCWQAGWIFLWWCFAAMIGDGGWC